jgi:hypothetical protein
MHLISEIERDFRESGCVASEAPTRPGFIKELPDYRVKSVILEKRL